MNKKTKNDNIKYFVYVRKSTEGKERQALSIPAQMDRLNEMFGHLDLEFVEDRASAFKPYNRPNFTKMIERIHAGERTGLIAWHPDRLSRNEKDAGDITYMIRTGVIEDLKLATYHFENTPEGIWMLQMALSQSQYESAKKGRDVKRGLAQSAKMGFYPAPAPVGYIDDKYGERGKKKKLPDEERFDLVRKMFDLMLTGKYTPPQIMKLANEEWGFRGPGGKKLSRSNIYRILSRPFYYGEFEYPQNSGNIYKGNHKPMITKDEFDKVQILMGNKQSTRPKTHNIIYRGPMKCGECGALITAEKKTKKQKNGNVHNYTYYHCTHRKKYYDCSQRSIEEKKLEKQIAEELKKLEIPTDFKEWALDNLREANKKEISDREAIFGSQRREYDACVRKIDNLIDMRADDQITENEYNKKRQRLLTEKARLKEMLNDTDKRVDSWLEVVEKGFNFAETASEMFSDPNIDEEIKKDIFVSLGSNLTLKDEKLSIEWDFPLSPIKSMASEVKAINERLEPPKNVDIKSYMDEIYSNSPVLLPDRDSNPNFLDQNQASYH